MSIPSAIKKRIDKLTWRIPGLRKEPDVTGLIHRMPGDTRDAQRTKLRQLSSIRDNTELTDEFWNWVEGPASNTFGESLGDFIKENHGFLFSEDVRKELRLFNADHKELFENPQDIPNLNWSLLNFLQFQPGDSNTEHADLEKFVSNSRRIALDHALNEYYKNLDEEGLDSFDSFFKKLASLDETIVFQEFGSELFALVHEDYIGKSNDDYINEMTKLILDRFASDMERPAPESPEEMAKLIMHARPILRSIYGKSLNIREAMANTDNGVKDLLGQAMDSQFKYIESFKQRYPERDRKHIINRRKLVGGTGAGVLTLGLTPWWDDAYRAMKYTEIDLDKFEQSIFGVRDAYFKGQLRLAFNERNGIESLDIEDRITSDVREKDLSEYLLPQELRLFELVLKALQNVYIENDIANGSQFDLANRKTYFNVSFVENKDSFGIRPIPSNNGVEMTIGINALLRFASDYQYYELLPDLKEASEKLREISSQNSGS